MINHRAIILETLLLIEKEEDYSHHIIRDVLDKYDYLPKQERSFIKRVTEGTLERKIELMYVIDRFSKVKCTKMKPVIRLILEMSVYQLLYMDAIPDSAVCNEAVKLSGKKGFHNLKGFVNGVLRTILRNKDTIEYPDINQDAVAYLSVRYSMPEWIVRLFLKEHGAENTEKMLMSFLEKKSTMIRINQSKIEKEKLLSLLLAEQVTVRESKLLPYALKISGMDQISEMSTFKKGYFQVQDISSMLVCELAGIREEQTVLDVCAAPGGKAMHAADILHGTGKVIACDVSAQKVALIDEHVSRYRYENVETLERDARIFSEEFRELADVLLVDVPCSGLGIMGRKNDIKYRLDKERLDSLSTLQKEIVTNVAGYVKPGGTIMYSTCTIRQAENEEMVSYILENLPFEAVDFYDSLPQGLKLESAKNGYAQFLPGIHGTDGFFIARFRRKG